MDLVGGVMYSLGYLLLFLLTRRLLRGLLSVAGVIKPTRNSRLPPGPAPFPVVGNVLKLGKLPHKSLTELAKTHGPLMSLRLFNKTAVVISSAAMAKEVLQKQDLSFSTHRAVPDSARAHQHHTASVGWMPISTQWRNLRKISNSYLFTTHMLDRYSNLRWQKVQELVAAVAQSCSSGTGVNIGSVAFATTLNLLSNTIFSVDWADPRSDSAQALKQVVWEITDLLGKPNIVDYFAALSWIDPQGIRGRTTVLFGKIFEAFDTLIDQRLQIRKLHHSVPVPVPVPTENKDMLDILLDLHEDTTDLSVNDIRHLLLDIFVAGTDTTSSTVEWAMAELLSNPKAMSKMRTEMVECIGKGNPVEEKDIAQLPYLQAVVKETFRLHPPVPFLIPRRVEAEVEIGGFSVPKDAQVLVNAWAIGRDPETWTDPGKFRPERFLGLDMDVKGRDFELIPFGAGRRICPGLPLATRMVHLMVASLIHSFEWRLENGVAADEAMDLEEKFGITLHKARPLIAVPMPIQA